MLTVLCRHVNSDWRLSTDAFLCTGKSNIMLTWKYIIVFDI